MDVEKDLKQIKEGFKAEALVRDLLKHTPDCQFGQIDVIAKIKDKWYSIEVKHQDMFLAPPFDGHGLPVWQVNLRLELYKDHGIEPLLFILDKQTGELMYNSLVKLHNGRKFLTGKKSRVIYPLDGFIKVENHSLA